VAAILTWPEIGLRVGSWPRPDLLPQSTNLPPSTGLVARYP